MPNLQKTFFNTWVGREWGEHTMKHRWAHVAVLDASGCGDGRLTEQKLMSLLLLKKLCCIIVSGGKFFSSELSLTMSPIIEKITTFNCDTSINIMLTLSDGIFKAMKFLTCMQGGLMSFINYSGTAGNI